MGLPVRELAVSPATSDDYGYMAFKDADMWPGIVLGFAMMMVIQTLLAVWIFWPWVKDFPNYTNIPAPERLLKYVSISYFGMALTGTVLTHLFVKADIESSPLVLWYGYNNACVNFDYPPNTYVMPTYWAIICSALNIFALFEMMRVWRSNASRATKIVSTVVLHVFMFIACFFSTCLAVGPEQDMPMHTLPFVFLIFGFPVVYIMHCIEVRSRVPPPRHATFYTVVVAVLCLVFWFKGSLTVTALVHGRVNSTFGKVVDRLFSLFFLLGPLAIFPEEVVESVAERFEKLESKPVGE